MFNFLEEISDTYTWPVTLKLPSNGGKVKEIKFYAEFNRLSAEREREIGDEANERIKKILQRAKQDIEGDQDEAEGDNMAQINLRLRDEVLVSVGETDKAGNYTAADAEKTEQLLAMRGATEAILHAYGKSKAGEKAKN